MDMMTPDEFNALVRAIQALGYDEETAGEYAVRIGDTPIVDGNGFTLVRDENGAIVERLKLEN